MKRRNDNIQRCFMMLLLFFITSGIYAQTNTLSLGNTEATVGKTAEMTISLINESSIEGGQFEVLLPKGVVVDGVNLANARKDGHEVEYKYNPSTGKLFILFYASPVRKIKGSSGELVKISLSIPNGFEPKKYDVKLEAVKLAIDAITAANHTVVNGSLNVTEIKVTEVKVSSSNGTKITPALNQLQLTATVTPADATNKEVEWSLVKGNDLVTLLNGLVSANGSNRNGEVVVRATAADGSGKYGELALTVEGFVINVTSITVSTVNGSTEITPETPSLQLKATIIPGDATNQEITWSITQGENLVNLSPEGVLTANGSNLNGDVVVRATSKENTAMYGELAIKVKDFVIPVTAVAVSSADGRTEITPTAAELQLKAEVTPANATNTAVTWSITEGSNLVTISDDGMLRANGSNLNGSVTVRATAKDGSGKYGEFKVTVKDLVISATSITISSKESTAEITPSKPKLQLVAKVTPENATNQEIVWSLLSGGDLVNLSETGLLEANGSNHNGKAVVQAALKADPTIKGNLEVTVKDFVIKVSQITVSTKDGSVMFTPSMPTIQLVANVLPEDAGNKEVTWSIVSGESLVDLAADGKVTMKENAKPGKIVIRATAKDGSGITGEIELRIADLEISLVEYFLDTDPGYGKGLKANLPTDGKSTFVADLKDVSDGFHTLYVRARDSYNNWGHTVAHPFLKVNALTDKATVTKVEYFIDTDPGYDKGVAGDLPGENGQVSITAGLEGLTDGFHTFYIRAKDSFGSWGQTVAHPFLKTTSSEVVEMEYYFNTDPGEGKGTPVALPANGTHVEFTFTADLSKLTAGEHTIYVRAKNAEGMWGLVESAPFSMIATGINDVEWLLPFTIYPSPADTECFISFGDNSNRTYHISIFSLSGQKVFESNETSPADGAHLRINTQSFPDGIYLINVVDKERKLKATKRLIILHK